MSEFLKKMEKFIEEQNLISKGCKVLAGFSGGADSTSLMYALTKLRDSYNLSLFAAHVNYNLRGQDSIADREFVKAFCHDNGIILHINEVTINKGSNLEEQARTIRFDFFKDICRTAYIDLIALGHNKNDVSETVLMNILRGSGITGLRGILPRRDNIIRPLLCFERREIVEYLQSEGVEWREDKSNSESCFTRNKIRNDLLPYIEKEFNPRIVEHLYNNARIYSDVENHLQERCKIITKKVVIKETKQEIVMILPNLLAESSTIIYYIFRSALQKLSGSSYYLTHNNLQDILTICNSEGSKEINLSDNVLIRKEYQFLKIIKSLSDEDLIQLIDMPIDDFENIVLERHKKSLIIEETKLTFWVCQYRYMRSNYLLDHDMAVIDISKVKLPLSAGFRKPGDTFQPLGMQGSKKLKDFFIDEKISKFVRDKVVIVRDAEKIVWIAGYRLDERVKVDSRTKEVLLIKREGNLS